MTKIKNFLCILALCLVFPGVLLLGACGEEPNNNGSDDGQNISYVEISTQNPNFQNSQFEFTYGDDINLDDVEFLITAHKTNGETFTISQNDVTIDLSNINNAKQNGVVPAGNYYVSISGQNFSAQQIAVVVNKAKLIVPDFGNVDLTLTYNGQEQNIITSKLDALMPQEGESLSSMIASGKLNLLSTSDNYTPTATNVLRDTDGNMMSYYLEIAPTQNYEIVTSADGYAVGNIFAYWLIAPKVLNMPTFANNGEVVFDWEVVNGQTQMVPAQMSLIYGTDDNDVKADMVSLVNANALTLNYFGSSTVDIELTSEYASNYALKEEAGSYYAQATVGEWRVVAYEMQPVSITGATKTTTYNDGTNDLTIPDFDYDPERTTITISMSAKEKQLFEIVDNGYNHYANGFDDAYSINFALKSNISGYSSPVTINGQPINYFTLYYHISKIDTPTEVQTAINAINFEINPQTYNANSPVTLYETYQKTNFVEATQNALTSDVWREYEQYGYDYTYIEPVDQAQDISNANETGYTVPLRYYYGRQNYNPVVVNAKLIVNRNNIEIYNVEYHLSDNDNGRGPLIYRYNHPITMTISNINYGQVGNWGSTSYQYCATSAAGEFSPLVGSPLNAGYYKAQFELSTDANHKYSMQDIGAGWSITEKPSDSTKFVVSYIFQINKRPITISPTIIGDWGTYLVPYCYEGGNKTIDASIASATIYYFAMSGATSFSYGDAEGNELDDILA
ncbi:MAG: hypothetical protein IJU58_03845, partial [Clostridia bacterium]|nr:hypothetical protein [Clostridia bacterium]